MKRKTWKWVFGISLAVLILLMIFTVLLWVLLNVGGVLLRLVFILDEDMTVSGIPFDVFLSDFVGSTLFYVYLLDMMALATSSAALVVTRKR